MGQVLVFELMSPTFRTFYDGEDKFNSVLNPIPAGVLENQDMLGGGVNLTPSPLNPMFDVQI